MEIVSKPIGSISTSVPSTSPTNSSSLPPKRARSCSVSCSQASLIQGEVFTDPEALTPRVKAPAPLPQNNCSRGTTKPEPLVEILAMDWREAEKVVVDKCEDLQAKLNLYTRALALLNTLKDIDVLYNEAEFRKKLKVMKESYCEADESIKRLLLAYGDAITTQIKEYWKRQATEILHLLKSHERQLRAAVTRAKENISALASNAFASEESNASKVLRAEKKQVLNNLKSDEEALVKDAGKQTKLIMKTGSK